MNRRTDVDYSRHVLKIRKLDGVLIHQFKRPNSMACSVVFINTCGVMTVTGDFGNWVFCREFHPSGGKDAMVSDGYWNEKARIHSTQELGNYDSEATLEVINEFENEFSYGNGREMNEEEREWVEELKSNVDDEVEYANIAYRQHPSSIDIEDVPFAKKINPQLNCVYDAFDIICELIRNAGNDDSQFIVDKF
mgnify:CR=1 FL=1